MRPHAHLQEDPSGDTYGDLDFDEFVDLYNALSPKAKKETKIQTAFRLYDSNMDGYLDPADLKQLLRVSRAGQVQLRRWARCSSCVPSVRCGRGEAVRRTQRDGPC